jgi:hypothetical protein
VLIDKMVLYQGDVVAEHPRASRLPRRARPRVGHLRLYSIKDVDGRNKPGYDSMKATQ